MTALTAKTKNKLRNIILNYGAHVGASCEYGRTQTALESRGKRKKPAFRKAADSLLHRQITVLKGVSDAIMLMDRLFAHGGRLLVVNGAGGAFQMRGASKPNGRSREKIYAMEGEWINGSCSNWSTLCKVAWNSYKLKQHSHSTSAHSRENLLNHWVSQASSTFGDLHLFGKNGGLHGHRLAYKRKPDCVLLINPEQRTIEECRGLAVPLCMLSVTYPFAAANLSVEGNRESSFLVYLMLHIIGYYSTKSV